MTDIEFHFNAPDKLVYACRYARKLFLNDGRLIITGPDNVLEGLDVMLWRMSAHDFVAHCRGDSDAALREVSPIVLTSTPHQTPHCDVLLNLGSDIPLDFGRFRKLVEVVSAQDDADRANARVRWRHYAAQGYDLIRHDLVQRAH